MDGILLLLLFLNISSPTHIRRSLIELRENNENFEI